MTTPVYKYRFFYAGASAIEYSGILSRRLSPAEVWQAAREALPGYDPIRIEELSVVTSDVPDPYKTYDGVDDDDIRAMLVIAGVDVPLAVISKWTTEQKVEAIQWAELKYNSGNSLNAPPQPDFLAIGG